MFVLYLYDNNFDFMYVVNFYFINLFMLYACVATSSFMNHFGFTDNSHAFDNWIFIIMLHSAFEGSEVTAADSDPRRVGGQHRGPQWIPDGGAN